MGMKIIVAAADSVAQDKAKADFVCTGTGNCIGFLSYTMQGKAFDLKRFWKEGHGRIKTVCKTLCHFSGFCFENMAKLTEYVVNQLLINKKRENNSFSPLTFKNIRL